MATIMEKDVLLELVGGAIAMIDETDLESKNDKEYLKELRENLYDLECEDIAYNNFTAHIQKIKAKYV